MGINGPTSHGNGTDGVRSILCDRGRFFSQLNDFVYYPIEIQELKKQNNKTPKNNTNKTNQSFTVSSMPYVTVWMCFLRFECFYIPKRSNVVILPFLRRENIVDIFFDTHTKKAKTQKRSQVPCICYCILIHCYFS